MHMWEKKIWKVVIQVAILSSLRTANYTKWEYNGKKKIKRRAEINEKVVYKARSWFFEKT